ncbi:MAG: DNA-directed polymerase [Chthonomonadaceae bacterium]|nr:DNA-directed polymerase [Chthonomonadaceae bacterium]
MIACFYMPQIAIATERIRALSLWGRPVALVGENDLLVCVSEEAVTAGVKPGQTAAGARALCRPLIVLPYDRMAYEQAAQVVWEALAVESSTVEPVAPEVCYVEFEGRDIVWRVRELLQRLVTATRFSMQVGLAQSKIVAYHAAQQAEIDTVRVVDDRRPEEILQGVPLASWPALEEAQRKQLAKLGLRTFGDVARMPEREMQRRLGSLATRLARLAQGQDSDPVGAKWPPPMLRAQERLEYEVTDIATIETALQRCAADLALRLRGRREFCRSLAVCLTLEDQNLLRQQERLPDPLDLEAPLFRAARRLLVRMQSAIDRAVVGVVLEAGEMGAGSGIQLELLDLHSNALPQLRLRHLRAAIHHLQQRFGPGCVVTARNLWQARRIDLWAYPFCHQVRETVQVVTDSHGVPVRFLRTGGEIYRVAGVHRHWREAEWDWDGLVTHAIYRIETCPAGLYELRLTGRHWLLCGIAD